MTQPKLAAHILVPTDFSQASELAMDAAAILARQNGAAVTLVHVVENAPFAPVEEDPESGTIVVKKATRDELHVKLDAILRERFPDAVELRSAVVASRSSAEGIVHYAESRGIDIIVMATHGRTGIGHALMGSVAEKVVRMASCPVLTMRSKAK